MPWPSPAALTDPLFQDLDRTSRFYLAHFSESVCKDLVVRDTPESNPFRELIPLTRKHPLLFQVLIATSAIHWSNVFRRVTKIPTGIPNPGDYLSVLRSKDLVTHQALIDALTAKQKAMSHLREVLDTLDPAGSEVALAAMHFFIKFDLIDLDKSDNQSWRAHLEGATSIMALLNPDSNPDASSRMLRDRVITDSFIYNILGSTLTSGGLAARVARQAFQFLPVMKRVELTSYLSCPPEILNIILSASELSHEVPWTDQSVGAADKALALIDEALAVDIPAWADYLRQHNLIQDLDSRVRLAAAHRSAACLYILQALPLVRSLRSIDTDFLLQDVLSNLALIDENDPYFKASSWPTFVAGAETRDPERRTWTLSRLLSIWQICPWGYLFTAIEMLKATWAMQDTRGTDNVNWHALSRRLRYPAVLCHTATSTSAQISSWAFDTPTIVFVVSIPRRGPPSGSALHATSPSDQPTESLLRCPHSFPAHRKRLDFCLVTASFDSCSAEAHIRILIRVPLNNL